MLIAYLVCWAVGLALATVGCTLPALLLGVVLIGIIFRQELLTLLRVFGPHLPAARDSS